MPMRLKPIASEADYEAARAERKLLWGAKLGTPDGNRLDDLERKCGSSREPSTRGRAHYVSLASSGAIEGHFVEMP